MAGGRRLDRGAGVRPRRRGRRPRRHGLRRVGPHRVPVGGRRRARRAVARVLDGHRGGLPPQPDGHGEGGLGAPGRHRREVPARPRHPGAGPHRAALRRRVRPARAPAARVRAGGQGRSSPPSAATSTLAFDGEYHELSLLPPMWSPGPIDPPDPPIDIAAVGPWMVRMAGAVADGVHVHPFHSPALPRRTAAARVCTAVPTTPVDRPTTSRCRSRCSPSSGDTEEERAPWRDRARFQIGFYGSTRNYGVHVRHARLRGHVGRAQRAAQGRRPRRAWPPSSPTRCSSTSPSSRRGTTSPTRCDEKYDGIADRLILYFAEEMAPRTRRRSTASARSPSSAARSPFWDDRRRDDLPPERCGPSGGGAVGRGGRRSRRRSCRARRGGPRRCAGRPSGPCGAAGSSWPTTLIGVGSMSAPCSLAGRKPRRSWNCGSSASVSGVWTGAMGTLCSSPNHVQSSVDFVLNTSARMACSSRLPRAWSAYWLPGHFSNRSSRPMAVVEVLPERLLGRHEDDVAVARLVDRVAHAALHPGRARRPALVVVGLVAGDLGLGALVGLVGLGPEPVHGGGGVGLGDLELAALAGLQRLHHAGEDAEGAEDRAGVDADRDVLGDEREALLVVLGLHDAGPRVVGDAVDGRFLYGPVAP